MHQSLLPGILFLLGFFFFPDLVQAHRPSDAYLNISVSESSLEGQWEIALRDLDHAVGLDLDRDGATTWGEVKLQQDAIAAYALARLRIQADNELCQTRIQDHLASKHGDEGFAVLRFTADCGRSIENLRLNYELLFDLDPLHRGLIQIETSDISHTAIFSPEQRSWALNLKSQDLWHQFLVYLAEGTWHIWIGFDHILFLVLLLLPAAQVFRKDRWQPRARLREAFLETAKIVTAFSFSHSLTLGLTSFGWLDLPSRVVEPAIAATIIFAALNNIYPIVTRRLWLLAFGFGLIHGMGFAGVLQDLGLPTATFLLSLLSFNLGVELGQLAIVSLLLPLVFGLRRTVIYPTYVLRLGSVLIAMLAAVWLVERAFNVAIFT